MRFKCCFLLLFFALTGHFSLFAQDAKPKREVGLQFNSINFSGGGFSAFFKKEKKENVYRRIRVFSGKLLVGTVEEELELNFSAGLAIGREKRKTLDDKLVFYQGPEFAVNASLATINEDDTRILVAPSFGWVVGLQHSFNDRWALNIETVPQVGIVATTGGDGVDQLLFSASVSNFASVGLVRKF